MSHVIKRDIFWKHREGKLWDGREGGKMKEGMRDNQRVMETFQVTFLFIFRLRHLFSDFGAQSRMMVDKVMRNNEMKCYQ